MQLKDLLESLPLDYSVTIIHDVSHAENPEHTSSILKFKVMDPFLRTEGFAVTKELIEQTHPDLTDALIMDEIKKCISKIKS